MPFLLGVHCVTHLTNLDVRTLFQLSLVAKIEVLFHDIYNYYAQNLKNYLERTRLVKFLEKKPLNFFMQCEDALNLNVVSCQMHLGRI